jgi:hypothetical protein
MNKIFFVIPVILVVCAIIALIAYDNYFSVDTVALNPTPTISSTTKPDATPIPTQATIENPVTSATPTSIINPTATPTSTTSPSPTATQTSTTSPSPTATQTSIPTESPTSSPTPTFYVMTINYSEISRSPYQNDTFINISLKSQIHDGSIRNLVYDKFYITVNGVKITPVNQLSGNWVFQEKSESSIWFIFKDIDSNYNLNYNDNSFSIEWIKQ